MSKRERTFSDMSIAESCIDVHVQQCVLMKRKPCLEILTQAQVDLMLNNIHSNFTHVDTTNILNVTSFMYNHIDRKKYNSLEIKTIIVEILSEIIDRTHQDNLHSHNYTFLYRPLLQDTIPSYIDILQTNDNINTKNKKRCSIL